jgi:hexosaminidase
MVSEAQQPAGSNIMPVPAGMRVGSGSLRIDSSFAVALAGYEEARLDRALERFLRQLARQTALPLSTKAVKGPNATLVIQTNHAGKDIQEVGEDESYVLEVTPAGAKLSAPTPLGTLHGLQTFLQLVDVSAEGFSIPSLTIQDEPRFPWRGLMIDSVRHFIPLDVIRRNLDGMEAVKMNVFHWHLSDNQGFRLESKTFPRLHEMGSDGLYYTQDEIRRLIAYARDRGIRVVPEFDVPGHSTAWFVGYPDLASAPGPYEIERRWGIFDPAFDPTREQTYEFLDRFIAEMAQLFPDRFFHVGGDEVNGKHWDASTQIQEFMRSLRIEDHRGLQAYFNKRLQPIVAKHGKSMIGWDEVLDPTLPKDITIHSWRGPAGLVEAVKHGYRGILSNGYYLDLAWPASRHYAVDPVDALTGAAADLPDDEKGRVLGGEACIWSEYVNAENIDSRIWPRNAAIAERLWSPANVRDAAAMYARLDVISARLEWLGLTHRTASRQMLQRIAGPASADEFEALRTLADVVEPVKDYTRSKTAPAVPTSQTPLNRVIDAVAPESNAARHFTELVGSFIAGGCRDATTAGQLEEQFKLWRDNEQKLQPLATRSFLVKEVEATSQDLSTLGAIGLAALEFLSRRETPLDTWKSEQAARIEEIQKPKAQLLLMPAPAVQRLVEACR